MLPRRTVAAYGLGLVVTFVALFAMSTAQPALIYLVPAVLVPTVLLALLRGEFVSLWTGESPRDMTKRIARETNFTDALPTTSSDAQMTANDSEEEDEIGEVDDGEHSDSDEEAEPSQSYGALRGGAR